jgi:long-chain fatty acid transport protein
MIQLSTRSKFILGSILVISLPTTALATNGYFSHGTSVVEKSLGGAGVAYSHDTLAAANNPAGMVSQGERYDVGVSLFAPMRNYSSTGGPSAPVGTPCGAACPFSVGDGSQSIDSENELFLIPQFGYNWKLDSDRTIGISVFGNGGMNTEYKGGTALLGPAGTTVELPGTFGSGTAGVDLAQLFMSTTYSAQISPETSWGISGIVAYQTFEAKGLGNFAGFSSDPGSLSNNGGDTSTGIGIRLGIQTEITSGLTFGAAYQPTIDMGEFDSYAGLFAEGGDFDIPSNFTVGIAWKIDSGSTLVFDIQQINYEDVAAVSNPIGSLTDGSCIPGPTGGTGNGCLGGSQGAGFGWEDMQILKLGYEWGSDNGYVWRVGYSMTDQPISDSQALFNILAPAVVEKHYTFGFSKALDADSSVHFAAMIAPSNSVKGANTFDPAQEIELEMDQYEFSISYNRAL